MQIFLTLHLAHVNGPEVKAEDLAPEVIDSFMHYMEGFEYSDIKTDLTKEACYELKDITETKLNICDGCGEKFLGESHTADGDLQWEGSGRGARPSIYHSRECLEIIHEKEGMARDNG